MCTSQSSGVNSLAPSHVQVKSQDVHRGSRVVSTNIGGELIVALKASLVDFIPMPGAYSAVSVRDSDSEEPVQAQLKRRRAGFAVAAAALLAFDCCLTFGQEVEWLYGTKWTAVRIHFSTSRYLPFVAIAMAIPTSRALPPTETNYCGPLGMATNAVYYLCIILAEAMLAVRTYVFWERDRRILIGMCTLGAACGLSAIVVSETLMSQPTDPVYRPLDCIGTESTVAGAIQYLCLSLYELGMLGLNWIAFRRIKRYSSPGRLATTLYRDGIMYVAAILAFSVINAVVSLTSPVRYSDILNSPQMVIHSILASRVFFNLRETTRCERSVSITIPLTEFRAAPQESSGFSDSSGTSSSGSGTDPAKTIDMGPVIDISRERMV